jgi:hypothetical protein
MKVNAFSIIVFALLMSAGSPIHRRRRSSDISVDEEGCAERASWGGSRRAGISKKGMGDCRFHKITEISELRPTSLQRAANRRC